MSSESDINWKLKAKQLADLHDVQQERGSVVPIRIDFAPADLELVDASNLVGKVEGKVLTPKQIRTFIFKAQGEEAMRHKEGAIYSVYDNKDNESHVGVGIMRSLVNAS